ncbi:MAG: succinyldiaminopimelate transaminase [Propionibacteriaceae bacterium]
MSTPAFFRPLNLPDFPWDTIAGAAARARSHPDGICDLSVGTPVDPTPELAREALTAASDAPGYPLTWGTPELRQAINGYLMTRWGAPDLTERGVLPVIGTKELVGWLPTLLGLGVGDTVVIPATAYPTYAVGVAVAGCHAVTAETPEDVAGERPALVWTNSPSNPTGRVADEAETRAWIAYCRERGALLVADECYGEFGWDAEPVSVLDARLNGGDVTGIVGAYSLSKRSNLAGYRAGFIGGDATVVSQLLEVRKHLGMMVPAPVQAAMTVLLGDDEHVQVQRERYAARRAVLAPALVSAGFRIDHSQAGLYLWATRGENCRVTVDWLADRGIVAAPGDFYGTASLQHVRIALTATDERIQAAAARLTA